MARQNILRTLCGLTFLIFLCPFFQECSDNQLKSRERQIQTWQNAIKLFKNKSYNREKDSIAKEVNNQLFLEKKKEAILTGYGLIDKAFDSSGFLSPFLPFVVIFVCSIFQFIYSIQKRNNTVLTLGIINLILILLFIPITFLLFFLEDTNQIKYGYYLFTINLIAIIVLSNKLQKYAVSIH